MREVSSTAHMCWDCSAIVGTEVLIRFDGDEGLLAAYNQIELKAPVRPETSSK
jgi:hypothetical protein